MVIKLLASVLTALLFSLFAFPVSADAGPITTLVEGQTGKIEFQSMTLTGQQFLRGTKTGTPVVISGDLKLPEGATGRVPAVVIVHGSGGVGPREEQWARELNSIGVAGFILDSFNGRGIRETATSQAQLSALASVFDAFRALELLSTHPGIDPATIAIMGFSRGGVVSRLATLKRFQEMHGPRGLEFAAYLPFYAACNAKYIGDEDVSSKPIRFFHGEADNYTQVGPCREYVERLRRAGKDVTLTSYPGAHHQFDAPQAGDPREYRSLENYSRCDFDESKPPPDLNAYLRSCRFYGAILGYNSRAHAEAVRAVKEFLLAMFKLNR